MGCAYFYFEKVFFWYTLIISHTYSLTATFIRLLSFFKKGAEFRPNSAIIETQKTQKLGPFAEIVPSLEPLIVLNTYIY